MNINILDRIGKVERRKIMDSRTMFCDFGKYRYSKDVVFVWTLLSKRDRDKTKYICNTIGYYKVRYKDKEMDIGKGNFPTVTSSDLMKETFICMKKLDEREELNSIQDVHKLLGMDKDGQKYKEIADLSAYDTDASMRMSLGFNKVNEKYYDLLSNMFMSQRVYTIVNCVLAYVNDGMDPLGMDMRVNTFLREYVDEYHEASDENKEILANNFYNILESSRKIKPLIETVSINGTQLQVSQELKRLGF